MHPQIKSKQALVRVQNDLARAGVKGIDLARGVKGIDLAPGLPRALHPAGAARRWAWMSQGRNQMESTTILAPFAADCGKPLIWESPVFR
eukprot:2715988-Rhodomonas_salina.2